MIFLVPLGPNLFTDFKSLVQFWHVQILKLVLVISQYLSDATKSSMGPTCLVFSNSGHEFLPTASFLLRVTLALSSAPAMVTRWSTTEVAWSAEVPCCRCGRLVSNDWSWGQQKWPFYHETNLKSIKSLSRGLLYNVPVGKWMCIPRRW